MGLRTRGAASTDFIDLAHWWLPIALLLACAIEMIFFTNLWWRHSEHLNFIQNVVFLNSVHVLFTYLILAKTDLGKNWQEQFMRGREWTFAARLAVVMVVFAALWMYRISINDDSSLKLLVVFLSIVPRHHEVMQSKGLLFCHILENDPPGPSLQKKFKTISILAWLYLLFSTLLFSTLVYASEIDRSTRHLLIAMLIAAIAVCFLLINFFSIKGSKQPLSLFTFNARFALDLLVPWSALATFTSGAVHGVEYTYTTKKLVKADQRQQLKSYAGAFVRLAIILGLCWVILRYPFYLFENPLKTYGLTWLGIGLMGIAAALTHGHYFLDHFIFSARYPQSRDLFLKPLAGRNDGT